MAETPDVLTPANENPWYVLMTLYGEYASLDYKETETLQEKNRKAWNAWAGQALTAHDQEKLAEKAGIDVAELRAWGDRGAEIQRQFEKEWQRRNKTDCPPLPDPKMDVELRATHFSDPVLLDQYVFPSDTHFTRATFAADTSFGSATFAADTFFRRVTFSAKTSFNSATFAAGTSFISATFSDYTYFYDATFSDYTYFDGATFSDKTHFISATFSANTYFRSATFAADTNFTSTTFSAKSDFSSTTFAAYTNFDGAVFLGFAYFTETKFGDAASEKICTPSFTDCQFEKPTSFREAVFLHNWPDLRGAVLHDKTSFTAKPEHWPKSLQHPQQSAEAARDSCAIIRHVIAKQELPEDEHFFFRQEMRFAGQIGPRHQGLPYRAFGCVSNYGYSILRPFLCLFALWLIPGLIYNAVFTWQAVFADGFTVSLKGFAFSFANIFKFLGFQRLYFDAEWVRCLSAWLQVLSAIQTTLGFVFLFFLGLGLRQRFRLR